MQEVRSLVLRLPKINSEPSIVWTQLFDARIIGIRYKQFRISRPGEAHLGGTSNLQSHDALFQTVLSDVDFCLTLVWVLTDPLFVDRIILTVRGSRLRGIGQHAMREKERRIEPQCAVCDPQNGKDANDYP